MIVLWKHEEIGQIMSTYEDHAFLFKHHPRFGCFNLSGWQRGICFAMQKPKKDGIWDLPDLLDTVIEPVGHNQTWIHTIQGPKSEEHRGTHSWNHISAKTSLSSSCKIDINKLRPLSNINFSRTWSGFVWKSMALPWAQPGLIGQLQPSTAYFSKTKAAGGGPHLVHKHVVVSPKWGYPNSWIVFILNILLKWMI